MAERDRDHRPMILLLEDEAFIALDMVETLKSEGYDVLGPCRSVDEVEAAVHRCRPDAAVLDINLGKAGTSFSVTGLLDEEKVPYLFLSGYNAATVPLPAAIADRPRLTKPVEAAALARTIRGLIAH